MILAILAVAFSDPPPDPEPRPAFTAVLKKRDDRFEAKADKGVVVWAVTSKTGIGGCEVALAKGDAPKKIVIRFVGLKSLEGFTFSTEGLAARTFLNRTGTTPTAHFDAKGNPTADAKAAVSLALAATRDGVEVTVTLAKPGKRWNFTWVDAYRG